MNRKNSLKMFFKSIVTKLGEINTDNGKLIWDGDEDLKIGDKVYMEGEGEDIEYVDAPDGEYTVEDGKVIVIVGGAVAEIKDPEAEVAPEDETKEDEMADEQPALEEPAEDPAPEENAALEERIASLEELVGGLQERIATLEETIAALVEAPAAESAFSEVKDVEATNPISKKLALLNK